MKLSERKKQELYNAIADPIMDERVKVYRNEELDDKFYKLNLEIWNRVCKVLKLER